MKSSILLALLVLHILVQISVSENSSGSKLLSKPVPSTPQPDTDYVDDDQDEDDDDDDDQDEDDDQSTTTAKPRKPMKVCVALSPAHASTRNGPFVSYECLARLCAEDESGQDSRDPDNNGRVQDQYKFRRPLFDWNSQFAHLLLVNGSCDSGLLNCWHKIEVNVDSLIDAMDEEGVEQIEIRCAVADYVNSYDTYNYVFGEATSVLRYFKGNRPHEPCNTTSDCGTSLQCAPSQAVDLALADEENSLGFCECPSQQLVKVDNRESAGLTTAEMRSMILVEDPHYLEQMCVPVRLVNESCLYVEQCRATDQNTVCRPVLTPEGVESSDSVCDCAEGFRYSPAAVPSPRCLRTTSSSFYPKVLYGEDSDEDSDEVTDSTTLDPFDEPLDGRKRNRVYIWWLFPPEESAISAQTQISHGFLYYGAKLFSLSNLAYLLMVILVTMPAIIILLGVVFYCHRRLVQARQYAPRRASFGADSIFYPEETIPSTPSEKQKSTVTFDFTGTVSGAQPIASHGGSHLFGGKKSKADDKLDLVDNDQLEQVHKFPQNLP